LCGVASSCGSRRLRMQTFPCSSSTFEIYCDLAFVQPRWNYSCEGRSPYVFYLQLLIRGSFCINIFHFCLYVSIGVGRSRQYRILKLFPFSTLYNRLSQTTSILQRSRGVPASFTGWLNERLSISLALRAPTLTMVSFFCGFAPRSSPGATKGAFRYRAENVHRLPPTQTRWFLLYQKSKKYHAMLEDVKEGT
jgi:hypothetical protein